jgi:hypothetical protein
MVAAPLFPSTDTTWLDVEEISKSSVDAYDRDASQRELLEKMSRNRLLEILPDRLTSRVESSIRDDGLLVLWKRFAADQLEDVLRDTLDAAFS